MAIFDQWDNFDFESASSGFINEMIKSGAEMGIASGITQTETKVQLRQRGFKFGNNKFSSLWQTIQKESTGFDHFSNVNINDTAFDDLLPERTYFNNRYRYVGSFSSVDVITGKTINTTLAIDSNKRLSRGEVRAQLEDFAMVYYGATVSEMNSLSVDGAIINSNYELEV